MCLINTKDDCSFQLFTRPQEVPFRFVAFFFICGMISHQISFFKWYSKQGYLKVTENTYPFCIERDKLLYVTFTKLPRQFWTPGTDRQPERKVDFGWFSNRTGTSVDDGKAHGKDQTRLPVPNLPLCHWLSQLFNLRAPSSTDFSVLLLNQP